MSNFNLVSVVKAKRQIEREIHTHIMTFYLFHSCSVNKFDPSKYGKNKKRDLSKFIQEISDMKK